LVGRPKVFEGSTCAIEQLIGAKSVTAVVDLKPTSFEQALVAEAEQLVTWGRA
jgi:hypothetical protein